MVSLFTTYFADFFDPVAPPPFLPVTLLHFLLSWNSTNTGYLACSGTVSCARNWPDL